MFKITLTPEQLYSLASCTVAASKKDATPVIESVRVSVEGGKIVGIATDRYRVARVTFPLSEADEGTPDFEGVTIQRAQIEGFAKTVKAAKPPAHAPATITLEVDEGGLHEARRVTLSDFAYSGATSAMQEQLGNFPPVARLFPSGENAFRPVEQVSLNIAYLADVAKLSHPALGRGETPTFRFTKTDNPYKPGPVLISFPISEVAGSVEYLLQPNLLKK